MYYCTFRLFSPNYSLGNYLRKGIDCMNTCKQNDTISITCTKIQEYYV